MGDPQNKGNPNKLLFVKVLEKKNPVSILFHEPCEWQNKLYEIIY